jgi:hypothetical protein
MASMTEIRQLIAVQEYKCAATGVELTPAKASLDHKTARSRGGTNDPNNLHIVHQAVNQAKGQMNWGEFVAMCHAVARVHADTADPWGREEQG